ncbi:MAG: rod shape-determining protein MreC [Clostridia bacterium]
MYKNRKKGIAGSIITAIVLIALIFITNISINNFSKVENVFNKIVMPIQNGLTYLKNKIAGNDSFFENIDMLKAENQELKKQNEELQRKLEELQIIKSENNILREYANLAEQYSEYETVAAYIINKDASNLSNIFVINVGTNNGVYENMAVMGKDGLIGHVISATSDTAKVQPIIDAASSVSGVTTATRKNVIVKGQLDSNKELRVNCMQVDSELVIGDTIETSGLGGIYPKGIKIGTIKEIIETKNVSERYAILETTVDFENLEYVLVIKK